MLGDAQIGAAPGRLAQCTWQTRAHIVHMMRGELNDLLALSPRQRSRWQPLSGGKEGGLCQVVLKLCNGVDQITHAPILPALVPVPHRLIGPPPCSI